MVDIAHINKTQLVIDNIYKVYEKNEKDRGLYLARLGASSIGEECLRQLWLDWRAFDTSEFDGRMLRLFKTGHLQEDRIVSDLKASGLQVWDIQEDGSQYTYTDKTGHFVVKLDGVVMGLKHAPAIPHVLEIKTHSEASFKELVKKGVQASKPAHYWQMQAGMLFSDIKRALYVSLCKNDEQYYVELIKRDLEVQDEILGKIDKLVKATIPPVGLSEDASSYGCKWCDLKEVCVGEVSKIKTCRSCQHVSVIPIEGTWCCGLHDKSLTNDEQKKGCDKYEAIRLRWN